jgi:curved DNA-binding protein CbpA
MASTLYDILEVIPTASAETIHAAYRSMISRYHPDKVAALGPELQAAATARTKEINFAYDILSDEVSRARYDEELQGAERLRPVLKVPASRPKSSAVTSDRPRVALAADQPRQGRSLLATFSAAVAGVALILTLPQATNVIFSAAEYSLTGHTWFFYDAENPVDAKGDFSGSTYLLVLWGWLFASYLFGLISYRVAVMVGETTAAHLNGTFAATNDRLFLFLTFVCVVAVGELFFSDHTMGNMLADMFILAGAYLAERGLS